MAKKKGSKHHIGIVFDPPVLYPPLAHQRSTLTWVTSLLPEMHESDFDYALNSTPGHVQGVLLTLPGYKDGNIRISAAFMEQYQGPWPARLELRYWKDGIPVDLGVLYLRDTRTVVPDRLIVELGTTTIEIPPSGEEASLHFLAKLVDRDGYELPFEQDYMSWWGLQLVQPTQGVSVDHNLLRIQSDAQPGEVQVRVSTTVGFEEIITITLV